MSILAFRGSQDYIDYSKLNKLICDILSIQELNYNKNNNLPCFSDPGLIYIIIDDSVCTLPWDKKKIWKDIKILDIASFLTDFPFFIGDNVKLKSTGKIDEIVGINISLSGCIIYNLSHNPKIFYLREELEELEAVNNIDDSNLDIVGWKCCYCGKILRSRKPHMCNGNYRCKKLRFSTIREHNSYIEIPEDYKIESIEGNKIKLKKK